jgi:ribosome-binding factor A
MAHSKIGAIKHAQRASFILREVSELFLKISLDDSRLQELYITRVELSPDRGMCTIFFHTPLGNEGFQKLMPILILYKPSLRSALAKASHARYTPDLKFAYDTGIDHQNKIEDLFNKLKEEGKL